MAESPSFAGPSSQPAPVERSARLEPDSTYHLDLERGSASQPVRHSSSNRQNASEPSDFFHLFKEDKNAAKIGDMPPGWPRIAAEQNNYYNYRTCRRFGTLIQKLLICAQRDLNATEDEIDGLLYSPEGDERFTLRDPLFGQALDKLLKMGRLLLMDNKLRELPVANADQHYGAYLRVRETHERSEADSAYMLRYEDMVQPKTDISDVVLNSITNNITENQDQSWIGKLVYFFFSHRDHKDKKSPKYNDKSLRPINNSRLKSWISIVMMLAGELVLLTPVLVLYLVPMQKGATAGTVVAFVLVLTPIIYFSRYTRFSEAVVGLVGFLAVLVAFLAQLGGGPSCGCP